MDTARWYFLIATTVFCFFANVGHEVRADNSAQTQKKPSFSTPLECARTCKKGEKPKICYYHFTLEIYTVLGAACQICTPDANNTFSAQCQCVLADGVEKAILTANRMIPGPSIQVCEGDKVVIDVYNKIPGAEVTIHWHGIWQTGSQYYDGVPMVTQCPIHQGNTFRYQWKAGNPGTHFWHAHTGLQKIDGLHGSIVIRQTPSNNPHSGLYDFDLTSHVMEVADWMHLFSYDRFPGRMTSHTGQDPDTFLINGKGQYKGCDTNVNTSISLEVFTVTPGKRYRFRLVASLATVCPMQLTIQKHKLTVISTDGESVKQETVDSIVAFSGERYDFILHAKPKSGGAYWIQVKGIGECGINKVQQLAILKYKGGLEKPHTTEPTYDRALPPGRVLNPLNGKCDKVHENFICVNHLKSLSAKNENLKSKPDVRVVLPFELPPYTPEELFVPNVYTNYLAALDGYHVRSYMANITEQPAPSPPISQLDDIPPETFCNSENKPSRCKNDKCSCSHQIDIPLNAVVEIVLVDKAQESNLSHAFHLHGYVFEVIAIGNNKMRSEVFDVKTEKVKKDFKTPSAPALKDTVAVPAGGYAVLRFRASNPGYWFFHCHFLFHIAIGMNLVFHVGSQSDLPPIPKNFPRCGNFLPPVQEDPNTI